MADAFSEKLAEAKLKMFAALQPAGGKTIVLVRGSIKFESPDKKVVIRREA